MQSSVIWLPLVAAFIGIFVKLVGSETGPGWFRLTHARFRAWQTGQSTEAVLWALESKDDQQASKAREREEESIAAINPSNEETAELPKQSAQEIAKTLDFYQTLLSSSS